MTVLLWGDADSGLWFIHSFQAGLRVKQDDPYVTDLTALVNVLLIIFKCEMSYEVIINKNNESDAEIGLFLWHPK